MPRLINEGQPFRSFHAGALGLTRHELAELRRLRLVRPVFRSVLVDSRVEDTRLLRCRSLALVLPRQGVICHSSAAWARKIDGFQPKDRFLLMPQCMVPHGTSRSRHAGVRCIEGYLPDGDVEIVDGVPMTTCDRTAVDLMRRLRRPYAFPRPQYEVIDHRGRVIARIDLAYPEIRLAMEYDGAEYHSHDEDRSHDEG